MTSPKAIKTALKRLPTGSEAYDCAYKEAMDRIIGQIPGSKELAMQVLQWIAFTTRPLTTSELRHALAVEIGERAIDEDNLPEIEDMVSVCAGLVTVDEEGGTIRLVHYTTQEYFERTRIEWFPDAQTDIAMACVTYLSFDTFDTGFCETDKEFESRLELNPLYDYAARNWGNHAHTAPAKLELLINDLLESQAKVSSCSQAMMIMGDWPNYSQYVPRNMTGAHLAACFGLKEPMLALLRSGHDLGLKNSLGQTPLSLAAEDGNGALVELLLSKGSVDPHSKDNRGQTPLSLAAENGHEEVVGLLLAQEGVDPDSRNGNSLTPLSLAAWRGHEGVVELLLAKDNVNPDSKEFYGQTPLARAARKGHTAVVKLLLAKDSVDPDSQDSYGWMPLTWAVKNGDEAVVELLQSRSRMAS